MDRANHRSCPAGVTATAVVALTGLFALGAGCGARPSDGEDAETCTVEVLDTSPADGADDAWYRGAVEFSLSEADPTATVSASFPGALSWREDGLVAVYTPTAPLAPDTAYTAQLDGCFGSHAVAFTTSSYGAGVPDPSALVGAAFDVDLAGGRWLQPAGAQGITTLLVDPRVLLGVTAADDAEVALLVAPRVGGSTPAQQDPDGATVALPAADFAENPWFTVDAAEVRLGAGDDAPRLLDLHVEGAFAADGTALAGLAASGLLDARTLAGATDAAAACETLAGFGLACDACPDDDEPYCAPLAFDRVAGTLVPDLALVEVP